MKKTTNLYTCDNCGKTEDMGFRDSLPNYWSRVEMNTLSGISIYKCIDLCNSCGYQDGRRWTDEGQEKSKNILISFFKKWKDAR